MSKALHDMDHLEATYRDEELNRKVDITFENHDSFWLSVYDESSTNVKLLADILIDITTGEVTIVGKEQLKEYNS